MENLSFDDSDYNLYILLIKLRRLLARVRERELASYGITPEQAGILYIITMQGGKATSAELARLAHREPHTVSGIIERMEKKGLLTRTPTAERRNVLEISATEAGNRAYEKSKRRNVIHKIMSALSTSEREILMSYLERLQKAAVKKVG